MLATMHLQGRKRFEQQMLRIAMIHRSAMPRHLNHHHQTTATEAPGGESQPNVPLHPLCGAVGYGRVPVPASETRVHIPLTQLHAAKGSPEAACAVALRHAECRVAPTRSRGDATGMRDSRTLQGPNRGTRRESSTPPAAGTWQRLPHARRSREFPASNMTLTPLLCKASQVKRKTWS